MPVRALGSDKDGGDEADNFLLVEERGHISSPPAPSPENSIKWVKFAKIKIVVWQNTCKVGKRTY